MGVALVPSRLSADRFNAGGLIKLFRSRADHQREYLLHRPEDRAREDLQEVDALDLSECRVVTVRPCYT